MPLDNELLCDFQVMRGDDDLEFTSQTVEVVANDAGEIRMETPGMNETKIILRFRRDELLVAIGRALVNRLEE